MKIVKVTFSKPRKCKLVNGPQSVCYLVDTDKEGNKNPIQVAGERFKLDNKNYSRYNVMTADQEVL